MRICRGFEKAPHSFRCVPACLQPPRRSLLCLHFPGFGMSTVALKTGFLRFTELDSPMHPGSCTKLWTHLSRRRLRASDTPLMVPPLKAAPWYAVACGVVLLTCGTAASALKADRSPPTAPRIAGPRVTSSPKPVYHFSA